METRIDPDEPDGRGEREEDESEEYGELLKFTLAGFAGGLIAGAVLDWLGFQRSGWGQWLVRTLSGEGESIFEGIYALRQRLRSAGASMAEAYGWGKVIRMVVPWTVDAGNRSTSVYSSRNWWLQLAEALLMAFENAACSDPTMITPECTDAEAAKLRAGRTPDYGCCLGPITSAIRIRSARDLAPILRMTAAR